MRMKRAEENRRGELGKERDRKTEGERGSTWSKRMDVKGYKKRESTPDNPIHHSNAKYN
jgi:hypothetical protein